MKYKHYMFGKHGFANTYRDTAVSHKLICHILRYPDVTVFEFKYRRWGFDIGYKKAK